MNDAALAKWLREALKAPTHAANDHNCQDWPPGAGCRGCDGNAIRQAALAAAEGEGKA